MTSPVDDVSGLRELIRVLRTLHDQLAARVVDLGPEALRARSFATEWTVAEVLSHLGSGAELALLRLEADSDADRPSHEEMAQLWALWDARTAEQQAVEAVAADERFLVELEARDDAALTRLHRELAGDLEPSDVLRVRIAEHAMHGWDIAVAFDDEATIGGPAVPVLLDLLPVTLRYAAQPHAEHLRLTVRTTGPARDMVLALTDGAVRAGDGDQGRTGPPRAEGDLVLPSEALLRLVYGRLDPRHTPYVQASDDSLLDRLRDIFRGF